MQNPWLTIWTEPRATIARVVAENPNRSIWPLAWVYGFCSLMNLSQSIELGAVMGTAGILILNALLAPFWGYVSFSIWSAVVAFVGKWLKGQGSFQTVRAAYAWSYVPVVLNIPLWLLMVILFGHQLFLDLPNAQVLPYAEVMVLFGILIAKVILAVWSLVIYINALSEVQKFSVLRAIINLVLAGLILMILFSLVWTGLIYLAGSTKTTAFLFWKLF